MDFVWYIRRARKMPFLEIVKRVFETVTLLWDAHKFRNSEIWPYRRFSKGFQLSCLSLPEGIADSGKTFLCYNTRIQLDAQIDWHSAENGNRWPDCHYSKINHRPGNPYGDIRYNWELNRLQFLPLLALNDSARAQSIMVDWLEKNPYQHGPGYISAMEVALRWISIYRTICILPEKLHGRLRDDLTGLAVCSGRFIAKHLSSYSSAGNHLLIEAVGLFWIGMALPPSPDGKKWVAAARKIIHHETLRQINPDGSNKEQTFWYLGFVIDALMHYLLLENRRIVPETVLKRIQSSFDFINLMTVKKGGFPDYGDRDDGFVFRPFLDYRECYFSGLLNIGSKWFQRPEWERDSEDNDIRCTFFLAEDAQQIQRRISHDDYRQTGYKPENVVRTYPDGGVTSIHNGKGQLVFRHAPLGLAPIYGHGHADALSIQLFWDGVALLTDIGSGQYNGSQDIRNYFRSTIAHNTIEVDGLDQSVMRGPFMWEKPHTCRLLRLEKDPVPLIETSHDGYQHRLGITHYRRLTWETHERILIEDWFDGDVTLYCRGAFHFGQECSVVKTDRRSIEALFSNGRMSMRLPEQSDVTLYRGGTLPFAGWISSRYGSWAPISTCIFRFKIQKSQIYTTKITIHMA